MKIYVYHFNINYHLWDMCQYWTGLTCENRYNENTMPLYKTNIESTPKYQFLLYNDSFMNLYYGKVYVYPFYVDHQLLIICLHWPSLIFTHKYHDNTMNLYAITFELTHKIPFIDIKLTFNYTLLWR